MVFQCTAALITLAAIEHEKLVFFYTQLLGQEPKPYIPNVYAEFQLAGLRLGIFKPKQTNQSEFENTVKSGMSLCLEVNDLSGAINHLNALGYPPPGKILTASHGIERQNLKFEDTSTMSTRMTKQHIKRNLTWEQWELITEMFPAAKPGGRPRTIALYAVVNAIVYVLCQGCTWRALRA